ncbi:MAG: hypothetical protein KZQ64_05710 [gamma proteobacterium symbiont of Bathyaustriella thionipta]|nr:hypothetical protein [gamma proteobacterium symbiont of Bathyaustriella thionipta]MCU7948621.1 hypothetical protein [gamma proteobacterium symbiont of Bathyaustriella thionipta]MCU7952874.1 hypothetical protein [gamma proteobacterium symbiont of Bathyaustriella thionipta]MCU7955128.1 hypothetical protein [gamma proteobacterium symbiont of Bathyaustriella thionipta]MCU7966088.1 hypothetical protein [gamma proteobacterium symbiont of Bathyaustriella thionipta]
MEILFTSELNKQYSKALEKLLFFNPRQKDYILNITHSINLFGQPEICSVDDNIKLTLNGLHDAQTLFALNSENKVLIGVMIYSLVDDENMVLLHIGVTNKYSSKGIHSDQFLVPLFIQRLRHIAKVIKGVKMITIMYGHSRLTQISV